MKNPCILVGGACVSIYTHNEYQSYDLDFITYEEMNKVGVALGKLGFRKKGRYFVRNDCEFYIDFVTPPVAVGHEPVKSYEVIRTSNGVLKLLTATDCVKDRLASYYHWNDMQALSQAVLVATSQGVDIDNVQKWSDLEGFSDKFQNFLRELKK